MQAIRTFCDEYLVRLEKLGVTDVVEILIIAFIIYYFLKWIKTTNAWAVMKGLALLLIFWLVAYILDLHAILWLFVNALGVGITALVIIFQPELRKVLEQLGNRSPFSAVGSEADTELTDEDIAELLEGIFKMAKAKTGALIVIEQQINLQEYADTGKKLDTRISCEMLLLIFQDKWPMHDGAVIIRRRRILAATCYLRLSDNMQLSKEMGTRHRAAVGVSEVSDSFTIVVSEERGEVSVARNGKIDRGVNEEDLRKQLLGLRRSKEKKRSRFALIHGKKGQ